MLVNVELAGVWNALHGLYYAMQPAVFSVGGTGSHGPQAGLGWRKSYLPGRSPVPECRTGYRLLARTREGRGNIDILKWIYVGCGACERNFDNLPLLDPVIR